MVDGVAVWSALIEGASIATGTVILFGPAIAMPVGLLTDVRPAITFGNPRASPVGVRTVTGTVITAGLAVVVESD